MSRELRDRLEQLQVKRSELERERVDVAAEADRAVAEAQRVEAELGPLESQLASINAEVADLELALTRKSALPAPPATMPLRAWPWLVSVMAVWVGVYLFFTLRGCRG